MRGASLAGPASSSGAAATAAVSEVFSTPSATGPASSTAVAPCYISTCERQRCCNLARTAWGLTRRGLLTISQPALKNLLESEASLVWPTRPLPSWSSCCSRTSRSASSLDSSLLVSLSSSTGSLGSGASSSRSSESLTTGVSLSARSCSAGTGEGGCGEGASTFDVSIDPIESQGAWRCFRLLWMWTAERQVDTLFRFRPSLLSWRLCPLSFIEASLGAAPLFAVLPPPPPNPDR